MENFSLTQIQAALTNAQAILIALPEKPSFDAVAAGLSFYLALGLKSKTKQTNIVCFSEMTVEFSSLVGVDKIKTKPKGQNLIISFDYKEDSIEKVSYNIEGEKFNLVIQPKEGFAPFSPNKVQYYYAGSKADLVFAFGIQSLNQLGGLYLENQELFSQAKTININLDGGASISEKTAKLIADLQLGINEDIANNLLNGIRKATKNFSIPQVNAETFEAAAFCLRAGARYQAQKSAAALTPMTEEISAEKPAPPPDWLEPKIYKGNTLV